MGGTGPVVVLFFFAIALTVGCSQTPPAIDAPTWDPDGFADAVLEKLDGNKDGSVDTKELAGAPGLEWGSRYIDTDKNQQLSREELVARFEKYQKMGVGLTSKPIQLIYKSVPLAGVKVRLVPEFFLAELIEPAVGEAFSDDGMVQPMSEGVEVPGVRTGYYRVVVESANVKVPAKYMSAESTPLGVEVSPAGDDPRSYGTIQLVLRD
jgi:hypothetical protein